MKIFRKILLVIFIIILVTVLFFVFSGYSMYKKAMSEKSLDARIEEIRSSENFTKISDVPDYYKNAVIAIEDHRFYSHHGFDFIATARALADDLLSWELKGGGSTISQQVAKNVCFTQEKKLERKIAELFVVNKLEHDYDKDEILEIYINYIYFGHGYYNIHDAAEGYYGKLPSELTFHEATLLAGVPNAPSVYAPTSSPELAEQRREQVIRAMQKYGYDTTGET